MLKEDKTIEIKIGTKKEKGKGRVSFHLLSNIFSSTQNIFNELGDYFAGEKFRECGPSKSTITELIELELVEAHHSDLTIVAELPPYQMTINEDKPIGETVLENFGRIIDTIKEEGNLGQNIGEIIKDEKHKIKVLKSISDFWPNKEFDFSIKLGKNPYRTLNYQNKAAIDKYLEGEKTAGDEELIGPLVSITIVEPLTFYVGKKPRIKCVFTSEIEDLAKKYIGKIVKIQGHQHSVLKNSEMTFENVHYIKPIEEWNFKEIHKFQHNLKFKESLIAKVEFVDQMIVVENEEYNILCISDNWDDCIEQFEEFFVFLYEEFALAPDNELTNDGINLKNKLKKLVVEISGVNKN
ncbi:MAG: hypothetical protein WA144_02320 [Candidatus Methanoperedens sp.]